MLSLDDILASMKASAPSAPAPVSHSWTQPEDDAPSTKIPPLDSAHRVANTASAALDYRFRCGTMRLTESEAATLCTDCSMAFALNSSNWLAATAEPRCALERMARAIFEAHTTGSGFDPVTSGAEWWAQVRGCGHRHEGIEYHWDVDEHFCDLPGGGGVHVHPHLSTVTYLTTVGAPTLVLDAGSPSAATTSAVSELYGPIRGGALSYPKMGKTIVFDGAKLHGAVPCQGGSAPGSSTRVTFLVNVWLGHRPHAVEPLPAGLARSMSQHWMPHPQHGALATALAPPPKVSVDDDAEASEQPGAESAAATSSHYQLEVAFGRNEKAHALRVLLPPATPASDSFRLVFKGSRCATLGPNSKGLKCDRSGPPKKKRDRPSGELGNATGVPLPGAGVAKKKKKKQQQQ